MGGPWNTKCQAHNIGVVSELVLICYNNESYEVYEHHTREWCGHTPWKTKLQYVVHVVHVVLSPLQAALCITQLGSSSWTGRVITRHIMTRMLFHETKCREAGKWSNREYCDKKLPREILFFSIPTFPNTMSWPKTTNKGQYGVGESLFRSITSFPPALRGFMGA